MPAVPAFVVAPQGAKLRRWASLDSPQVGTLEQGTQVQVLKLVELEDGVTVPFYLALRDILSGEELLWSYGTAYWSRKRQRWGSLRRAACDCRLSVSRALAPPLPTRAASGSDPAKPRVSRAMGSTDPGGKQDEVRAGDVRAPPLISSS